MADSLLDADLEIDRIVDHFEQGLRRGDAIGIEDYAALHPQLGQRLVRELLATEIEYRRSQRVDVDWAEYLRRFPDAIDALRAEKMETPPILADTSLNAAQDSAVAVEATRQTEAFDQLPEIPLNLSDYQMESVLGGGGQGDVFLATQRSLGRQVAVKILRKSSANDTQSERRFLREARTLAQTSHPQIVTIHGIGRTPDGELFLVMEYIPGNDLARQIAEKKFPVRDAIEITLQIARAVEHAHARGVIHRDLKPSNVLWHEVRGPVVTDFGLAKDLRATDVLTVTEQLMGTPIYMAPEQAHHRFGDISERTDVYGLAATLYALLTGRPPLLPSPLAEILQQLTSDEPVTDPRQWRSELPSRLCATCLKGLAKYPEQRHATITDFSQDLQRCLLDDGHDENALGPTVVVPALTNKQPVLEPGRQFGRYRLLALLSRDSTRKVFRAQDDNGRQVLLKCLPAEWLSDAIKRSQFRREVLLASQVSHPCMAQVIEAGTLQNTEFLALEYVEGQSIAELIVAQGPLSESQAIAILRPIAEALQLIHDAGVLYRDLRPQHIFHDQAGQPRLAEVRLSRADLAQCTLAPEQSGTDLAALPYQAPEFWMGETETPARDIYMLGATLFALVTGQPPFDAERDHIKLLVAKNAGRFTPLKSLAPDLSDDLCALVESCLQSNPARRPASAQAFADRLAACGQKQQTQAGTTAQSDPDNLLHAVWDQLDPELQDAFSLAYNKKRRTGSTRISTKDLFEAMARLGTGPLKEVFDQLPIGALPEPVDAEVPVDRVVLTEQPLLSDCVRESLIQFQKLGSDRERVTPVDLFVDVAKHGHGSSVVRLREHGVDPAAMERIVQRLGLRVVRRELIADQEPPAASNSSTFAGNPLSDDNVQFSVYRPKVIPPETWQPLLAFAHLSELPPDAPPGMPDPIAEVQRQAEQILSSQRSAYQSLTSDSSQSIPRSSELTFVPNGDGLTFNPPQRSFLWQEPVHREEFRFKAAAHLDGQSARGRLIAEVGIVMRVDRKFAAESKQDLSVETRARRFRRIFACVSRNDQAIIADFQRSAQLMQDTFLTSQFDADKPADDVLQMIRSADVFQLYWSNSSLHSSETEREWRYALSLQRCDFIRSLYWEEPFPADPARSLPPAELLAIGFQRIPIHSVTRDAPARLPASAPQRESIHTKLSRSRKPRVSIPATAEQPPATMPENSLPAAQRTDSSIVRSARRSRSRSRWLWVGLAAIAMLTALIVSVWRLWW